MSIGKFSLKSETSPGGEHYILFWCLGTFQANIYEGETLLWIKRKLKA